MLDHATNELLARVGPNTPCGNLLRHYWHPVGYSAELSEAGQTKRVRILGEDLVLARTSSGNVLLIQERCVSMIAAMEPNRDRHIGATSGSA